MTKCTITLMSELSISSALVAKARFIGHKVIQILTDRDKCFWSELAVIGVRSSRGILFCHKCFGNVFVKDEVSSLF